MSLAVAAAWSLPGARPVRTIRGNLIGKGRGLNLTKVEIEKGRDVSCPMF